MFIFEEQIVLGNKSLVLIDP